MLKRGWGIVVTRLFLRGITRRLKVSVCRQLKILMWRPISCRDEQPTSNFVGKLSPAKSQSATIGSVCFMLQNYFTNSSVHLGLPMLIFAEKVVFLLAIFSIFLVLSLFSKDGIIYFIYGYLHACLHVYLVYHFQRFG